jgi:hypothetical protein
MDWREQRDLRAQLANSRLDRQLREQQNVGGGGAEGGGCAGCGGCLLLVAGTLIAIFVVGWLVIGHAGSGSAAPGPNSEESVQLGPYTQVFDTPLPADPTQAKIIEGFRQGFTLWMKSDIEMALVPPVTNYVTGHARGHMIHAVAAAKARNRVPAGTDRFFLTQVMAMTDNSATVTTCDDTSKFREENPRTGEIDPAYTPKAGQEYVFETWHMVLESGTWAISDFSFAIPPNPRAATCQP